MALNPGDTLSNGHYRIIRQLGRGGFGFVYLAQDTLLGEDVAIKELIPALVGDEVMLKRFLAEAKATMRLTHKQIVRTHNVFSEGGNYYIVMEYMAGGSLEDRLREQGPLPVDGAVRVAAEVCEGLACAHEEGVVHCDLKPHNILFDAAGQAKVADFGIAHVSGEMLSRSWMTPAGFVAGTLPYMSPEQADGVRDDPRVDVYALGAVLYRTLTGWTYLEFDQRETPRAQSDNVQRIYRQQPLPPSSHDARIPAWLDGVVLRALAKRPGDRFHTAMELRAALAEPPTRRVGAWEERPAPAAEEPMAAPVTPVRDRQPPARLERPAAVASGPAHEPEVRRGQPAPVPSSPQPSIGQFVRDRPIWLWAVGALVIIVVVWRLLATGGTVRPAPRPTVTLVPAATPTPKDVQAGDLQTRSKDAMVMVYVPAGEFSMGSTNADSDARDNEKPQHTVTLGAFWIDRTEVTNTQYRECVAAGACTAPKKSSSYARSSYYGNSSFDDYPVIYVDWNRASAYCRWAGARLPTEAEWEKAARGTDGRVYPWGNSAPDCNRVNYGGTGGCVGDTSQVGSYPTGASPYGALDMAGNVWEWVADWYDSTYYTISTSKNPKGPNSGDYKLLRGGSWPYSVDYVRAANRNGYYPVSSSNHIGFRCVAGSPGG
jgi:formylglycine-generating enzyme required for sulfatase activity/serine/threonine protein kinase